MRDNALERAITEAGGVTALARAINVTPQAISQWDRVPAERAIAVEQATKGKVTRQELRPDLFGAGETKPAAVAVVVAPPAAANSSAIFNVTPRASDRTTGSARRRPASPMPRKTEPVVTGSRC